jgi:transposase
MHLKTFESIVKTEKTSKRYLLKSCWKNYQRYCTCCKNRKIYHIRRDHYRCSRCGYEFGDFTGRWIAKLKLSPKKWLQIIKLFKEENSAHKASQQMEVSYPTVLKAFIIIRKAIAAHNQGADFLVRGDIGDEESYLGEKRKGLRGEVLQDKIPVFGILEKKGKVEVKVLSDVSAESILNLNIRTVRKGPIVYTNRFEGYDTLMFCGYQNLQIDNSKKFSREVFIDGQEGFWNYAKERINKFHGVSKERFPFYLKEMEFRYNNRQKKTIFKILVQYLCDWV